jgi:hypothetical protein
MPFAELRRNILKGLDALECDFEILIIQGATGILKIKIAHCTNWP